MANSPHPVLFRPVAEELRHRGHELIVTTRDHAQTRDLTLGAWPDAAVIGRESPASRIAKAGTIVDRVRALRKHVAAARADVAVSLNSYAQIVAARLAGVPAVTLMDYEYQPANHLAFRLATRIAVPEVFPSDRLRTFGARARRVTRLAGFKEELYLDRRPGSPGVELAGDGVARVLFRPPAEGSLYHRGANLAFDRLVTEAARRDDVQAIVLPRLVSHREHYGAMEGVTVPARTIDGLALLRASDVFVGAGGTMSREAALLGVRAYTAFSGRRPAVDEALIRDGRLHDLATVNVDRVDFSPGPRGEDASYEARRRERAAELRSWLIGVIEAAAASPGG